MDRLNNDFIEALTSDSFALFFVQDNRLVLRGGVLSQGGEKIAQAALGGINARSKTKNGHQVGIAGVG